MHIFCSTEFAPCYPSLGKLRKKFCRQAKVLALRSRKMLMTAHMISMYGVAVAAIGMLCWFARQNQKSGWKRNRAGSLAEALNDFYRDLGIVSEEVAIQPQAVPQQLTSEEELSFSAQMLKLRAALGASAAVTQTLPLSERELVHR